MGLVHTSQRLISWPKIVVFALIVGLGTFVYIALDWFTIQNVISHAIYGVSDFNALPFETRGVLTYFTSVILPVVPMVVGAIFVFIRTGSGIWQRIGKSILFLILCYAFFIISAALVTWEIGQWSHSWFSRF
ncbi:MAG: hypothetical protein KGI66_03455 [Patescibacteria group bacterium]|nr:hypothetical protein [Patescibacteria group bacterium]